MPIDYTSQQKSFNSYIHYLTTGFTPQKANQRLKQVTGKGISVSQQSNLWYKYGRPIKNSAEAFYARTSGRLRESDAGYVPWTSKLGYKYQVRFSFSMYNPMNQTQEHYTRTMGLRKLLDKNSVLRRIKYAVQRDIDSTVLYKEFNQRQLIEDSIEVNNFLRFKL